MNEESSRSHSIFIITINQKHLINLDMKSGKLFLVDLAGSEKVKKTGAVGKLVRKLQLINNLVGRSKNDKQITFMFGKCNQRVN